MRLSPTRFTKIDGTAVAVTVTSSVGAKAAVKELKHKKRELKFLRGALAKQRRATRRFKGGWQHESLLGFSPRRIAMCARQL